MKICNVTQCSHESISVTWNRSTFHFDTICYNSSFTGRAVHRVLKFHLQTGQAFCDQAATYRGNWSRYGGENDGIFELTTFYTTRQRQVFSYHFGTKTQQKQWLRTTTELNHFHFLYDGSFTKHSQCCYWRHLMLQGLSLSGTSTRKWLPAASTAGRTDTLATLLIKFWRHNFFFWKAGSVNK